MTTQQKEVPRMLREPAEVRYAAELQALAAADTAPRPPGWKLSPRAVRTFILGSARPGSQAAGTGKGGKGKKGSTGGDGRHHRGPDQVLLELRPAPGRGADPPGAGAGPPVPRPRPRPDRPLRGDHPLSAGDPGHPDQRPERQGAARAGAEGGG